MKLPIRSWNETLAKLGLRWAPRKPKRPSHHKKRLSQLETLESRSLMAVSITDFGLYNDTGSSVTDKVTIDPTVYVMLSGAFDSGASARVEFDHQGDNIADGSVATGSVNEEVVYNPRWVQPTYATTVGSHTLKHRLVTLNSTGQVTSTGSWTSFAFSIETPPAGTWSVTNLALENDTGSSTSDKLTFDPTIKGKVVRNAPGSGSGGGGGGGSGSGSGSGGGSGSGSGSGGGGSGTIPGGGTQNGGALIDSLATAFSIVEIDDNNDSLADRSITTETDDTFSFDAIYSSYGAKSVKIRAKEWSFRYNNWLAGPWTTFTFQMYAEPSVAIDTLTLANDTGTSATDKITEDAAIQGTLPEGTGRILVEFDKNNDNIVDGSTFSDEAGNFAVLPLNLTAGAKSFRFRTQRYDAIQSGLIPGDWKTFDFTYEVKPMPEILNYTLANPMGTSGSYSTAAVPVLKGNVAEVTGYSGMDIEFDHNNDGVIDGRAVAGDAGVFEYRPVGLTNGTKTIRVRTSMFDTNLGAERYGAWTSYTFVMATPAFTAATVSTLVLLKDDGVSATDNKTTEPALTGQLTAGTNGRGMAYATIEFDHNADGVIDGTTVSDADGKFTYVPIGLTTGSKSIRARVQDWKYSTEQVVYSAWKTKTFTLQVPTNTVPVINSFTLKADTGTSSTDNKTANAMLVGHVNNDQTGQQLIVEFDHNNDGVSEAVVYTDTSGNFQYDARPLPYAAASIKARAIEWNPLTGQYQTSAWVTKNFTFQDQPDAAPVMVSVGLAAPVAVGSSTTERPEISGRIINEYTLGGVKIELDTNNDGVADQSTYSDSLGNYNIIANVSPGTYTMQLRTSEVAFGGGSILTSAWSAVSMTYTAPADVAPTVSTLALVNITGSATPTPTSTDPTLNGTITNDGAISNLEIQFDFNNDSTVDAIATTDADGKFQLTPEGLAFGSQTIRARVKEFKSDGTPQTGSWNSIAFTYANPAAGAPKIDSLLLIADTGQSNTDHATADGRVSGHVANVGTGVTVEIDTNGDNTPETTISVDSSGNFSYTPALVTGFIKIRGRVQGAEGAAASEWLPLVFVYHTNPDGTEAQAMASAYVSYATQWQAAQTNYQTAITTADGTFRTGLLSSNQAYSGALSTAANAMQAQIASARAAYESVRQSAENSRRTAIDAANSQFIVDLANFSGDKTYYELKEFVWPDAPPANRLVIPDDSTQPQPPMDAPNYTGVEYDFSADVVHQNAISTYDNNRNNAIRTAEIARRNADAAARTNYDAAIASGQATYTASATTAKATYNSDSQAGTNPVNIQTEMGLINIQKRALAAKFDRDNRRADEAYGKASTDLIASHTATDQTLYNTYASASAAVSMQYPDPNSFAHRDAHATVWLAYYTGKYDNALTYSNSKYSLEQSYESAKAERLYNFTATNANLDKQIAEKEADAQKWIKDRLVGAQFTYDTTMASVQKTLTMWKAWWEKVNAEANAASEHDSSLAKKLADIDAWQGNSSSSSSAVSSWSLNVGSAWADYQKQILAHAKKYVDDLAPLLRTQATDDADSVLAAALTAITEAKGFKEDIAELTRSTAVDDATSWRDYKLLANIEAKNSAYNVALRKAEKVTATAAAARDFTIGEIKVLNSGDSANDTKGYGRMLAKLNRDTNVTIATAQADAMRYNNWSSYDNALPGLLEGFRNSAKPIATANGGALIQVHEDRGEALSLSDRNFSADMATDTRDRSHSLSDGLSEYEIDLANHAKSFSDDYHTMYLSRSSVVNVAIEKLSKDIATHAKTVEDGAATLSKKRLEDDTKSLKDFYVAVAQGFESTIGLWSSNLGTAWSLLKLALATIEKERIEAIGQKLIEHSGQIGTAIVSYLNGVTTLDKSHADTVAGAIKTNANSSVSDLAGYTELATDAGQSYSSATSVAKRDHDKDVASQSAKYIAGGSVYSSTLLVVGIAELDETYKNAMDAAQWEYERGNVSQYFTDHNFPSNDPATTFHDIRGFLNGMRAWEQGPLALAKRNSQAHAGRDHTVHLAEASRDNAKALGGIHLTAIGKFREEENKFASLHKSAADGLSQDDADSANTKVSTIENAFSSNSASISTLKVGLSDATAGADGALSSGVTAAGNDAREDRVSENGNYDKGLYEAHAVILATAANSLPANGAARELATHQSSIAQNDATWAAGTVTVRNGLESAISTALATMSTAVEGAAGAIAQWVHNESMVIKSADDQATGAQTSWSIAATGNSGTLFVDRDKANTKFRVSRTAVDGAYDVAFATAKNSYDGKVADALVTKITTIEDATLAYILASPLDQASWASTAPGIQALNERNLAIANAETTYVTSVKTAKIELATDIGNAAIASAGAMGEARKVEYTDLDAADSKFIGEQKADLLDFNGSVTLAAIDAITGNAAAIASLLALSATGTQGLLGNIGDAVKALFQDQKPVNSTSASSDGSTEAVYQQNTATRIATRAANAATGASTTSRLAFDAAKASAVSSWLSGVGTAFATLQGNRSNAKSDELVAFALNQKAENVGKASAETIAVANSLAIAATRDVGFVAAGRAYVTSVDGRTGTRLKTESDQYGILDGKYGDAAKKLAVDRATADKTYYEDLFALPENATPQQIAALENARIAEIAEAETAYENSVTSADQFWTNAIIAADTALKDGEKQDWDGYRTLLAGLDLAAKLGIAGSAETMSNALAAFVTAKWSNDTTAENTLRSQMTTVHNSFEIVNHSTQATAVAGINSAMNLPWTGYEAAKASSRQNWISASEVGNRITYANSDNSSHSSFASGIGGGYTSKTSSYASAEKAFDIALANAEYDRELRRITAGDNYNPGDQAFTDAYNAANSAKILAQATADKVFATAFSNAKQTLTSSLAANKATYEIANATSWSSALSSLASTNNTPWAKYDAAYASANAAFVSASANALAGKIDLEADAERDYAVYSANAKHTQMEAIDAAFTTRSTTETTALEAKVNQEATAQEQIGNGQANGPRPLPRPGESWWYDFGQNVKYKADFAGALIVSQLVAVKQWGATVANRAENTYKDAANLAMAYPNWMIAAGEEVEAKHFLNTIGSRYRHDPEFLAAVERIKQSEIRIRQWDLLEKTEWSRDKYMHMSGEPGTWSDTHGWTGFLGFEGITIIVASPAEAANVLRLGSFSTKGMQLIRNAKLAQGTAETGVLIRNASIAPTRSTLIFADDPLVDVNILIQASHANPNATTFLNSNRGLISYTRATRNEFLLGNTTQAELSLLTRQYGVIFDDSLFYKDVMAEAAKLREAIKVADAGSPQARVLTLMDSRQLAASRLSGIEFVTNDLKLFKRARDFGIKVHFVDLFPGVTGPSQAAQKAAAYIPRTVVVP